MSETPPPPPPPSGWQPGWQESWQPATGGPPAGQNLYGQPPSPQVPYGAPQVPGYGPIAPDHPKATTVLVLGILSIVVCGVIAPFAWVIGNQVIREIDASGGAVGGRSNANVGRILGMVVCILMAATLVMGLVGFVVYFALGPT